jgi:hypothetical protein
MESPSPQIQGAVSLKTTNESPLHPCLDQTSERHRGVRDALAIMSCFVGSVTPSNDVAPRAKR